MRHTIVSLVLFLALLTTATLAAFPAQASNPFAMPSSGADQTNQSPTPPTTQNAEQQSSPNLFASLLFRAMRMQQTYFRGLAKAFHEFDLERSFGAAEALISISFAYGIFHAVGPGHGKVVVSSYLLADEGDLKRGILLASLGALGQAITAILAVGLLAIILGLTHRAVAESVPLIERISFVFVIGVGAMLIWRTFSDPHNHSHDHHGHNHAHDHDHDHDHHHAHDGHAHMPTPKEIRAARGWRDMAAIVLAVGLRPCTGAILVLLFALAQGAFLVGTISTLAMSVGTAITVSTLAILTVTSRHLAMRLVGTVDNKWTDRVEKGLKLAGGLFILVMGILMLTSSFLLPAQPLI